MKLRPTAWIAFGMFASAAAVGVRSSEETPVLHGPSHPKAVWPAGAAVEILGVNESVSFPEARERRTPLGSEEMTQHLVKMADLSQEVGARWTRGHTVAMPRLSFDRFVEEGESFARMDQWVEEVQRAELKIVAMVGPWPGNRTERFTPRYQLGDQMEAYLRFVRQAVERYDGDGVDDFEGLTEPITVWEIDNEPDLKNAPLSGRRARSGFATPAEFAAVVVATAGAIREAHSEAIVLQGGIGRPSQSHGYEYMTELFKQPGVMEAVDVVSLHVYHRGPDVGRIESAIRRAHGAAPGKPIWLTETSVPAQGRHYWMNETWQAEMLFRVFITSMRLGVERVFWHTLVDPPPAVQAGRPSGTKTNSLFKQSDEGEITKKPVGVAFERMGEVLDGVQWDEISALSVQGGRGVSLGEKGFLVYGETDNIVLNDLEFTAAVDLLSGEPVRVEPRTEGRVWVNSQQRTVWLTP